MFKWYPLIWPLVNMWNFLLSKIFELVCVWYFGCTGLCVPEQTLFDDAPIVLAQLMSNLHPWCIKSNQPSALSNFAPKYPWQFFGRRRGEKVWGICLISPARASSASMLDLKGSVLLNRAHAVHCSPTSSLYENVGAVQVHVLSQ